MKIGIIENDEQRFEPDIIVIRTIKAMQYRPYTTGEGEEDEAMLSNKQNPDPDSYRESVAREDAMKN